MKVMKPNEKTTKVVFVLFAALNALGYDEENNPHGMSKERRAVRRALPRRGLRMRYAALARHMRKEHPWHLIHKVLLKRGSINMDLRKFAKEREVARLWLALRAPLAKQAKMLAPVFKREVAELIKFLKREPRAIKRVIFVFNPLDAYWRGYSFIVKDTGYVIAGPGTKYEIARLVRHELLHFLAPRIIIPHRFTSPKAHHKKGNEGYGNRTVIAREYVVRGFNLLYEREVLRKNIASELRRETRRFPHIREVLSILKQKN
ncbi:MAG: hypothetical protein Q8P88_00905 [Candidatus Jorgensenbacteria bacterium]|nr:hypothetical protein [Candidatus Jorgensenbacteria bacterium]